VRVLRGLAVNSLRQNFRIKYFFSKFTESQPAECVMWMASGPPEGQNDNPRRNSLPSRRPASKVSLRPLGEEFDEARGGRNVYSRDELMVLNAKYACRECIPNHSRSVASYIEGGKHGKASCAFASIGQRRNVTSQNCGNAQTRNAHVILKSPDREEMYYDCARTSYSRVPGKSAALLSAKSAKKYRRMCHCGTKTKRWYSTRWFTKSSPCMVCKNIRIGHKRQTSDSLDTRDTCANKPGANVDIECVKSDDVSVTMHMNKPLHSVVTPVVCRPGTLGNVYTTDTRVHSVWSTVDEESAPKPVCVHNHPNTGMYGACSSCVFQQQEEKMSKQLPFTCSHLTPCSHTVTQHSMSGTVCIDTAVLRSVSGRRQRVRRRAKTHQANAAKSIKCLYVNADGLKNSTTQCLLQAQIKESRSKIIVVVETHFHLASDILKIPGFHSWSAIRPAMGKQSLKGGGITIYVHDTIPAYKLDVAHTDVRVQEEYLWVALQTKHFRVAICGVYMAYEGADDYVEVNTRIYSQITNHITDLSQKEYEILLVGDFNAHVGDEGMYGIQGNMPLVNENGDLLIQFCRSLDLQMHNSHPQTVGLWTWQRSRLADAKGQHTIIDYILTKSGSILVQNMVIDDENVRTIGSDHNVISWEIHGALLSVPTLHVPVKWNWKCDAVTNWSSYTQVSSEYLQGQNLEYTTVTSDMRYALIRDSIWKAGETTVSGKWYKPRRSIQCRRPEEVRHLMNQMRILKKSVREHEKNDGTLAQLRDMEKQLHTLRCSVREITKHEQQRSMLKQCEKVVICGRFASKSFYKRIAQMKRPLVNRAALLMPNGIPSATYADIKGLLHTHWDLVFKPGNWPNKGTGILTQEMELRLTEDSFTLLKSHIKIWEVQKALKGLRSGTSAGVSNIPPEFLKYADYAIIHEMCILFNQWFELEMVPEHLMKSKVTMLHKKGPTNILSNYRTIAIGDNIHKVYLKVLSNRLDTALERSNMFGEMQAGFRRNRCCQDNLLLLETLKHDKQRRHLVAFILLLDICKAYDRVHRDLLWALMRSMGFPEKFMHVLEDLYRDPKGTLHFQDVQSEELRMKVGLRQGCPLSPALFATFIAPLGRKLEQSGLGFHLDGMAMPGAMFADDIMLVGSRDHMKKMMKIVAEYASEFCVEFSAEKSVMIPLKDPPTEDLWTMGFTTLDDGTNIPIEIREVEQAKYLGVIIERSNLGYKTQREAVIAKAKRSMWSTINIARNLPNMLTMGARIWEVYAKPRILYGLDIVDCKRDLCDQLGIIERQMCRMITQLPSIVPIAVLYALTGIEPIGISILRQRWRYFNRVRALPQTRWARKALNHQLLFGHYVDLDFRRPTVTPNLPPGKFPWIQDLPLDCQLEFHGTMKTTELLHEARRLWKTILHPDGSQAIANLTIEVPVSLVARKSWLQLTQVLALQEGIDIFDLHNVTAMRETARELVQNFIREGCDKHTLRYATDLRTVWGDIHGHIPEHSHWLKAKLEVLFVHPLSFVKNVQISCLLCGDTCPNLTHHVIWTCADQRISNIRSQIRYMIPTALGTSVTTEWTEWLLQLERTSDERTNISSALGEMLTQWKTVSR